MIYIFKLFENENSYICFLSQCVGLIAQMALPFYYTEIRDWLLL